MLHSRSTFAALLLSACVATAMPAFAQSVDEEVAAAYAAWDAAFNAGDATALGATYTDDGVLLPPTHTIAKGPAAVSEFFNGLFGMGFTNHKLELIEARGLGDVVVAAAKWSAEGKDASGAAQPATGLATHVFVRQDDGALKLRLHIFN